MKISSKVLRWLMAGLSLLGSMGCRKANHRPEFPSVSSESVNSWVLDSMQVYYYWNAALPDYIKFKQKPADFFKKIIDHSDRFSALVNPDLPESYPPSLVHTMGFDLISVQNGDGTVATMVNLVVPGADADVKGLHRGDMIKTIDGVTPTAANISTLTAKVIESRTAVLQIAHGAAPLTIGRLRNSEPPVYLYKVLHSGAKSYGYLFLNSFEDAALNPLLESFSYFKQQQVQELILDLRYNPGGSVPVAAALASMIAGSARETDVFVDYRGNSKAGVKKRSFADELARLPQSIRKSFAQLSAYRLGINRIFILSGNHTASAAELTINALKPYLNVIQLGGKTLGKDMASFVIKDYRNPQVVPKWEIYPMVFKLYNAAGKGDYSSGLVPDQPVEELSVLPFKPFGDLSDPLIRQCLVVSGGAIISALRKSSEANSRALIFDSREIVDRRSGIRISKN
jgi:C-terminal processing protease CtpA/Prc